MATITIILTTIATILMTKGQQIDIQDLTNNNGYIPIKIGEHRTINHYDKILHFINLTTYDQAISLIADNIKALKATTFEDERLIDTLDKSFNLLKAKIDYLQPRFKTKRALINILGKGLKYIAGTMDSDDEQQIMNALDKIQKNEQATTDDVNKMIYNNNFLTNQINNITTHINKQQILIQTYINEFRETTQNKIKTLEDDLQFMQHTYQINNDITLLQNHINDIGQIIFSSKIGIIPTDILTQIELNHIHDFDSYKEIKIAVIFQNNNIIITILIPQFSSKNLSKIRFEPIPNKNNMTIVLENNEILLDENNNIYDKYIKDNLEKNLKIIENDCITNILNFEEAFCNLNPFFKSCISEIMPGIIVFKNFFSSIEHDCNKLKIKQTGTFLIRFENFKISITNNTFENYNIKIYDTFILPNKITKIKGNHNFTNKNLQLENLYTKQIKQEEHIKLLIEKNSNIHLISLSSDLLIICIVIISIFISIYIYKYKLKFYVSPELQLPTRNIENITNGPFLRIKPNL